MTTWFITRHPGARQWALERGLHIDRHCVHLEPALIEAGDTVIGSLPVHLAGEVCQRGARYFNLSLDLPASARGKELTAEELNRYNARLEQFSVHPGSCNNPPEEQHHDSATTPATRTTSTSLARATPGCGQPEGGVSPADSGTDAQFDGTGTRTGGCSPTAIPSDSTRPLEATRELPTVEGTQTYSKVSEQLAVQVAKVLEALFNTNPERIEITPDWIRGTHRQLAGSLFPEWAGRFRITEVQVGTHFPPPPHDVAVHVTNYCLDLDARLQHTNDSESIATLLAWADWRFQWIHPFKDFNGRLGRILLLALCFKLNLPPANPAADDDSRTRYFNALRDADQGDLSALDDLWIERLCK